MISLPPLNWLKAFEAAARHSSFKKAADELNVTPAAVSQHVKSLEDYYDIKLFVRQTRSLKLTRVGKLAAPLMSKALEKFTEACDVIKGDMGRNWLTITAPLSFCMKWLVPRLETFNEKYPKLEIRLNATDELVDICQGQADIGIRYGNGDYPDLEVRTLIDGVYHIVASPELLERHGGLNDFSELDKFPLLHTDWRGSPDLVPGWDMLAKAAGVTNKKIDLHKGHKFSNEMMSIDAAVSGLGIALVSQANSDAELQAGRLVKALDNHSFRNSGFQYHLVRAKSSKSSGSADLLYNWLSEQGSVKD
ncbi:LysR substrate-binding domain-containing protein [uncultured Tateyamaria sp.]|uniref:LysR substrate-binding domain-containing protein n=1 Tax=uncultured Tateyamaria sp. TaxID=455651 RepID=UPI00261A4831|nr:LysR substrate-binding domain-containing protein [uncultured Tateyamaria sp.]